MPSDPPTRANALVTPISRLLGYLECHCPECDRQEYISLTSLSYELRRTEEPGHLLLRDVLPKLKCRLCKVPPDWVDLMDRMPFASVSMPKRTYCITVLGRKAEGR